jgi:hypothetical protein
MFSLILDVSNLCLISDHIIMCTFRQQYILHPFEVTPLLQFVCILIQGAIRK